MFESELTDDRASSKMARRTFLSSAAVVGAGLYLWHSMSKSAPVEAEHSDRKPEFVSIVEYSDSGERQGVVCVPKIEKSDGEWRKQLSFNAFDIARHADTEMAFTGEYWNRHDPGLYRCICCDTALFNANTKFDSGTGWPSFWEPLAQENIQETHDRSFGMVRTAVACRRCDGHLGHVFADGPQPTGLRYCINSASLHFVKSS